MRRRRLHFGYTCEHHRTNITNRVRSLYTEHSLSYSRAQSESSLGLLPGCLSALPYRSYGVGNKPQSSACTEGISEYNFSTHRIMVGAHPFVLLATSGTHPALAARRNSGWLEQNGECVSGSICRDV